MTTAALTQALSGRHIDAVIIGGSAGGVHAMLRIFTGLQHSFRIPVIALLHVLETRDSRLAEVFQRKLAITVKEAADKEGIVPGTLYFASPGYHLSIEHDRSFSLSCEPPLHFSRPSIDILMESAAEAYGARLAGILLTGANQDGAAGLQKIKQCGGLTVVQDPMDAEVATMPEEAIRLETPDLILHLQQIQTLLALLGKN